MAPNSQNLNKKLTQKLSHQSSCIFQNLETIRRGEEELAEKLRLTEKRLAEALNTQNDYERQKREAEERLNTLTSQNQKLRDDLEDVRSEAEKESQKWKSEAYAVRAELKSL